MRTPTTMSAGVSEETLVVFIRDELLFGAAESLSPGDELLTSGLLDSMSVMSLVAHLEELLGRPIPDDDITVEHFANVASICTYLRLA